MPYGEDKQDLLDRAFASPQHPQYTAISVFAHLEDEAFQSYLPAAFHDRCRDVVAELSDDHIRMVAVTIDTNSLGIIVNHGYGVTLQMLAAVAAAIDRRVRESVDRVCLAFGVGTACDGAERLGGSYQEAVAALSRTGRGQGSTVAVFEDKDSPRRYSYTAADESRLINLLEAGFSERAEEQIDRIVASNADTTDKSTLRELYLQMYQTVVRVAYLRGTSPHELLGAAYMHPLSPVTATAPHKLRQQLEVLTQRLGERLQQSQGRFDLPRILRFIQEHFHEQIFLESVSEVFQLNSRYLSRAFKVSMGVSFGQYLAKLRVEEAKRLLSDADIPVTRIATHVGFGSRNTFTRVFKQMEGVTPTQYRVLERNRGIDH
jgi:AraC-like DNA-binding protein